MKNLIYIPLERIDSRYTTHLDDDITKHLIDEKIDFIKVEHNIKKPNKLKPGMFLDAAGTIITKSIQISKIAQLYQNGKVTDKTTFFFSDLWFPGIESLAYLNYFFKVNPKIKGILHAGSFTDTDFVRDMERWAKNFEEVVFDISDEIFVASDFIKEDVLKKRMISKNKLTITPLPLDSNLKPFIGNKNREKIIVFNGRNCDEKQPYLFDLLEKRLIDLNYVFIKTYEHDLSKKDYYELLSRAEFVVSFALQENFGYGIAEAVTLGCIPILPNRLVYPEIYHHHFLYNNFDECEFLIRKLAATEVPINPFLKKLTNPFKEWFK